MSEGTKRYTLGQVHDWLATRAPYIKDVDCNEESPDAEVELDIEQGVDALHAKAWERLVNELLEELEQVNLRFHDEFGCR